MTSPTTTIASLLRDWRTANGPAVLDIRQQLYTLLRDGEISEMAKQVRQIRDLDDINRLVSVGVPRRLQAIVAMRKNLLDGGM